MGAIDPRWRKSSYSGNGGNCVEVGGARREANGMSVFVRDTQDRTGPVLRFTPSTWRKFADQVKRSLASDLSRPCARSVLGRGSAGRGPGEPGCGGFPGFPLTCSFPRLARAARYAQPVPCTFPGHVRAGIRRLSEAPKGVWGEPGTGR